MFFGALSESFSQDPPKTPSRWSIFGFSQGGVFWGGGGGEFGDSVPFKVRLPKTAILGVDQKVLYMG